MIIVVDDSAMWCLQAVRQQHALREASLERPLQSAHSRAAQAEAAQVHRTQQDFADDCLKVGLHDSMQHEK